MSKVVSIYKKVSVWLVPLIAILVTFVTVVSVKTLNRADKSLFGYKMFVVLSDSMKDTFESGDLIFVKSVNPETLVEGDIIAYFSESDESYGEVITHKIKSLIKDENGNSGFITYGTTTGENDENEVSYHQVIGKYCGKLSGVGNFTMFLRTFKGYVCCILLPFLLIIGHQVFNTIKLFGEYKKEKVSEIDEKQKENDEMREEIERLRSELAKHEENSKV